LIVVPITLPHLVGSAAMGEVRLTIQLTNAFDDSACRRGQRGRAEVRHAEVEALVDTGAVQCVLPPFVADQLGLMRPFRQVAEYADGRREEVDVTEPVLFEILGRKVYEECLVLGDEVLIGQTALEKTDLHVDCRERRLLPNPAHPYQPVIKIK
jgi:clan AA aspartic protease